jgi:type I restriction enzyme, S subunit
MSRIDALIAALSPGGAEFKRLGDVGSTHAGLTGKTKADFADGNARFVSYMNAFNNEATNVEPGDRVVVIVKDGDRQNRGQRGDILFTGSSKTADEAGMSSAVTRTPPDPLYLNSFCFGFRPAATSLLAPDFAKHLFRSAGIRRQIVQTANGVTRFNVSKSRFLKVRIPIPPVNVQREIVQILDISRSWRRTWKQS